MNIKMLGAAFVAGLVLAGCGTKEEAADEVALSVNGEKLMQSKIDADVEAVIKAQGDKIPEAQREYARQSIANQIAQSFIVEKVLVAKAKADGYTVTDADRKNREDELVKNFSKMPDAPKSMDEFFKKHPLHQFFTQQGGSIYDAISNAEKSMSTAKERGDAFSELERL